MSPTELADAINTAHRQIIGAGKGLADVARRAGELLIEAKKQVGHGRWLPWLVENCPELGERQAQRYMRVAREWVRVEEATANPTRETDLPASIRGALAVLAERDQPNDGPNDGDGDDGQDDSDDDGPDDEEDDDSHDDDGPDHDEGDDDSDDQELKTMLFRLSLAEHEQAEKMVHRYEQLYAVDRGEVLMRALRALLASDEVGVTEDEDDQADRFAPNARC